MAISSEWAGPPVEWAGLPVSPTLPYHRVSKVCLMRPGHLGIFCLIGSTSRAIDLRILESMLILKLKHVLNDSQSSYPLSIANI